MTLDPALTRTAAALYTERAAKAQAARGRGGVSAHEATRHLRPWLAIACLAGADVHPLTDLIAERRCVDINTDLADQHPTGGMEAPDLIRGRTLVRSATSAAGGLPETRDGINITEGEARTLVAADLAEPRVWQSLLEVHRDQLLDALPQRGDPNNARFTRAAEVARLAAALGCRPYLPAAGQQRKAA